MYDEEIQRLKEQLDSLQRQQEPSLNVMKQLMGDFNHADFCGVAITRYKVTGKVNYQRLLEDKNNNVDKKTLDRYRGQESERCRVTVTGSKMPKNIIDEDIAALLDDIPEQVTSQWF